MTESYGSESTRPDPTAVTHIAGPSITIGPFRRQRCSWCGAVIEDLDLTRVAVQITEENPEGTLGAWEQGALIRVYGGDGGGSMKMVVDPEPSEDPDAEEGAVKLPSDACGLLDPAVTK